jgi:anaerobic C4-dicarboxylate transporter DcuA
MQEAGGMAYMVKCAETLLRKNPKYINLIAPATTFVLTTLAGTGYTAMSVLNVIQQVAKDNGVRPSQPLSSAVVASQIAITASPISGATAAMYVVVEHMGVSFFSAVCVILPAALFGCVVATFVASRQGSELSEDPIYLERVKQGLVSLSAPDEKEAVTTPEAKRSVFLFLAGVIFIVAMLMFKSVIGHHLGSKDIIIITMYFVSFITAVTCKVPLARIKHAPIFRDGAESIIVILGIVWLSSTIIGAHINEIKQLAGSVLQDYPALLSVVFFGTSALLFSQGATSALLVPVAATLGVDADTILASFVAVSALYITNIYPTTAFAIATDDTGSFLSRRWNGSLIINHPFFLPGVLGIISAVPMGFLLAHLIV